MRTIGILVFVLASLFSWGGIGYLLGSLSEVILGIIFGLPLALISGWIASAPFFYLSELGMNVAKTTDALIDMTPKIPYLQHNITDEKIDEYYQLLKKRKITPEEFDLVLKKYNQ